MRFLRLAVVAAVLKYFFDPQQGAQRRARVIAFFRQRARSFHSEAHVLKQKATHLREEPKTFDDQTLKAKVESEVFRPADSPKGDVDVNVENGVVFLRGQVERQELVGELEDRVRKVQGVERVENLLNTAS
jgi:osmotically-inducible protein OsmY